MIPIDSVIVWKWAQPEYRSTFGPETVNTLYRSVQRWYPHPHRFICVTNDANGIDAGVEILPDFGDFAGVYSPHGSHRPSCYRRLRLFHPEAAQWFGQLFVSLDLDTVIVGDLTPVWQRPEPFVIWGNTNKTTHYNGSMQLLTAGARSFVWNDFNPVTSPAVAKASGNFGSDQGWISYRLGPGEAMWSKSDGVYSYRNYIATSGFRLPRDARIVFWHGRVDPWSPEARRNCPWLREHYR